MGVGRALSLESIFAGDSRALNSKTEQRFLVPDSPRTSYPDHWYYTGTDLGTRERCQVRCYYVPSCSLYIRTHVCVQN